MYRCGNTGVVIDDGVVGRYYVSVGYRPLVARGGSSSGEDWSITVIASENIDMITRYRDMQLMMFAPAYEAMVTRHLQVNYTHHSSFIDCTESRVLCLSCVHAANT